uniref:Uncharacterized protein n=1 Tax=Mycobacterium riyadhense TaxID=486698 RepID=A0A653F1Z8_9MYCO|nr:hypothetical protein BIN_B_05263 [Mycobacterium riyadhense]
MQTEPLPLIVAIEGDLGEQLLTPTPDCPRALECRPILIARACQPVIQRLDVYGLGTGGGPLRQRFESCAFLGACAKQSRGMPHPCVSGLVGTALRPGMDSHWATTVLVGAADSHLELHRAVIGDQQRRFQNQLVESLHTGLGTGGQRHLHKRGARQQHHVINRVINQPRMRLQ